MVESRSRLRLRCENCGAFIKENTPCKKCGYTVQICNEYPIESLFWRVVIVFTTCSCIILFVTAIWLEVARLK